MLTVLCECNAGQAVKNAGKPHHDHQCSNLQGNIFPNLEESSRLPPENAIVWEFALKIQGSSNEDH
jgi:hypothetical protein